MKMILGNFCLEHKGVRYAIVYEPANPPADRQEKRWRKISVLKTNGALATYESSDNPSLGNARYWLRRALKYGQE